MKVLFVYPNATRQEYIPLGIAYLSASLKAAGHETSLFDGTFHAGRHALDKTIGRKHPDLAAISIRSPEAPLARRLIKYIKDKFAIPIIVGGVHATVAAKEVIGWEGVDFVCTGEGERAFVSFCNAYGTDEVYRTKNFLFKRDGKIVQNSCYPLIEDLDSLPFPDRSIFDLDRYLEARDGSLDVLSGRGCPFGCTYCVNHFMQKFYQGNGTYVRMRRVESILDEIEHVMQDNRVKRIEFVNDIFALSFDWLEEFAPKYSRRIGLPFVCNARPEMITPEVASCLKTAGCVEIQMGIESGSEELRRGMLGRQLSNQQIINAFKWARQAGMRTYAFNITGLPKETEEDYWKSIRLNQKVMPDAMQVSVFQPYPGTRLQAMASKNGWIKPKSFPSSHRFTSIMRYPDIGGWKIRLNRFLFRYRCLRPIDPKESLKALLFDLFSEIYSYLRHLIPAHLKRYIFRYYARP